MVGLLEGYVNGIYDWHVTFVLKAVKPTNNAFTS